MEYLCIELGELGQMTISDLERRDACTETIFFYERSQDKFHLLLNLFKAMGYLPELGSKMTDLVLTLLKGVTFVMQTKELPIL